MSWNMIAQTNAEHLQGRVEVHRGIWKRKGDVHDPGKYTDGMFALK